MTEKILNIDLNDTNSNLFAEILGNKTCKKILGLIAEQEGKEGLSETDISRKLGLAANTVNYNVQKLIKADLIEVTKSFFWSVKGKKIKTYKLANKKIVISTKKSFKSLLVTSLLVGIVGFVVKVGSNIYSMNNFGLRQEIMVKSTDLAYSAPNLASGVVENSNNLLQTTSLFQNVLPWFAYGIIVGFLLCISYNKLKGGSK
jgi:DNA-binding transcriptional ArsR family regulator